MHISTRIPITKKVTMAVISALALCLAAVPGSAHATAPTPQSICGNGYYVQRQHALPGAKVYQLYNGSYNCVVTIKNNPGSATRTTAGLKVGNGAWSYDTGGYTTYAGPVKQYAKGSCVSYFGFHGGESFTSQPGSCG
jgi:hypothetical protein